MQWYENTINNLITGKSYSHKALIAHLMKEKPGLSANTYHWAISGMVRDGILLHNGYDDYTLTGENQLQEYHPSYTDLAQNLAHSIRKRYPYIQFTVFETVLMNDFLNHLIAQNTVFIQAQKECSIFIFRFLQESEFQHLMYKPGKKDYALYWAKDSIVVTDLISEAPMRTDNTYEILLEKMLVDMCADKLISLTFSKSELPDVFDTAEKQYRLDKNKLLRYARRRNREKEVKRYLLKENDQ